MSEEEIIEVLQRVVSAQRFDGLYTTIVIILEAIERFIRPIPKGKRKECRIKNINRT